MDINIRTEKFSSREKNENFYIVDTKMGITMLPYVVSFVMLLQIPMQIFLLDNIHIYIIILAILFLLVEYLLYGSKIKCWKVLSLILFILCWIPLSSFILPSAIIPIIGAIDYLLPILFWSLYFSLFIKYFSASGFCKFLIEIGVFMAIFGIYQTFIDPSLFGIMTNINPYFDRLTLENVSVFRISSFYSSTQVYSFYTGMCVALLLELWHNINIRYSIKWFMLVILLIGGLLAGGKIFILLSGIPLLYLIFKKIKIGIFRIKIYNLCLVFFIVFIVFMFFMLYYSNVIFILNKFMFAINRIFLFLFARDFFIKDESARLSIMLQVFSLDFRNVLFGNGLGTASYSAFNTLGDKYLFTRFTSESYFISWWYEMGIFGAIAFVGFFGGILLTAFKKKVMLRITILSLVTCMFFVPTFYMVSTFPAWGILLFPYYYSPNEIS